ncbi:MAG: hypothetical protein G3M70_05710 [Candidatus Nitronauta litoralis]|uniref:Penicillin-binding C-terminal domain-containing protein n=1 Tax=Candidatus Nitronauta litoralis TaxID=2705533 RepID=A0A7T0FZP3_9BACT|nr:MAG: hypothetical protein G3M70_05710 [Candidatus Nitronauta litoralis]
MFRNDWKIKRYAVALALVIWVTAACDNLIDDKNPFSTTPQALFITPENTAVAPGGTITFTATNGKTPVSWTVSDTTLANINVSTGAFTAGTLPGTVTITVTDASGETATARVTITTATILVTPSALTLNAIPGTAPDFNVVGNVGTTVFTLGGFTGGYAGATINSNTGVVTVTALPTLAQGNQTLTVTAADGIATSGTATLTLIAQ